MNNLLKYSTIIIPSIVIFTISQFFMVKDAGSDIPFRPPAIVFAIVWPILLLLLGISWYLRTNLSIYYIILVALLALWIVLYNYSKVLSFIDIILSLCVTILLVSNILNNNKEFKLSNALLIPLALWLSFASTLNGYQIFN